MNPPPSLTWLKRPWAGAAGAVGWPERRGWAGLGGGACCTARRPVGHKKRLRVGAARWLRSGHRPERAVWLGGCVWVLLAPARGAKLPPTAREAGQHWPRRASGDGRQTVEMSSDGAEAHRAASGRCGGFAQSCGWCWSFDRTCASIGPVLAPPAGELWGRFPARFAQVLRHWRRGQIWPRPLTIYFLRCKSILRLRARIMNL